MDFLEKIFIFEMKKEVIIKPNTHKLKGKKPIKK
jgi:hypothetical protein